MNARKAATALGLGLLMGSSVIGTESRADAPPGRYSVTAETVYDTKTTLTWQRVRSTTTRTWNDATAYCASLTTSGGGWRLPSIKELWTLVDLTKTKPTIDTSAFTDMPSGGFFWSSSLSNSSHQNAWSVYFQDGETFTNGLAILGHTRCVR